jgi:uncharacterized integral membrane protein
MTTDPSAPGPAGPGPPEGRDSRREARLVLAGVAVVLLVWFAASNTQDVSITFWVTTKNAPLIVVIVVSALLGMLTGALAARRRSSSRRKST